MVKIVCEGKTDKNKIAELLQFLDINYSDDNFIVMGNKSNIFKIDDIRYKTLKQLIKVDKISKILFIVDADYLSNDTKYGGYDNTIQALNSLFIKLDIENLSNFYISCNPIKKDGYLESLLLSTVDGNLKKCYSEFLDCLNIKEKKNYKNMMEELHRVTKPNKPYDFNHVNFEELKDKLIMLFLSKKMIA